MSDFNAIHSQRREKGLLSTSRKLLTSTTLFQSQAFKIYSVLRFTRFFKDGKKSKLDRLFNSGPGPFNHCPILLKVDEVNFGPKPFRVFYSWLDNEDLQAVVSFSWTVNSFHDAADFGEIEKALLDWDLKAKHGTPSGADLLKREE
ncbi:LOW QUALITY PROTEIN: hypothetical protein OSB04_010803 [Centaurea solstitialis]|uniref:Uncharacterized protein n=1 Tax=Centaurea solstitialis TaxID=347529 RepID=A0AA38WNH8_9ASTR|nr:LOW QUALITY PROTEIN: hypothetical protein OSB04_010803 [Centaurea solstitialis]